MPYIREDQADIRVKVDGVAYGDGNSWYSFAGGDLKAAGSKTRPGGMGREKEQGGPATRSDITLTIQNSDSMVGQHNALESECGRGKAVVTVTYLDDYGNVMPGAQFRATGMLLGAQLPGQNSNSATVGMYTLTIGCDELGA